MADDIFECAQFVKQQYPDGIGGWPEKYRLAAHAARDRIIGRKSVVEEKSYCIDSSHERWPLDIPARFTHALMYEIKLSSTIDA